MGKKAVKKHYWRTRKDPFEDVWSEVTGELVKEPFLNAKILFEKLKHRHPGSFCDGQLRTLQRRLKDWRNTKNINRECSSWMLALLQGNINGDELKEAFMPVARF